MHRAILAVTAATMGAACALADDALPTYKVTEDLSGLDLTAMAESYRTDRVEGPGSGVTVTIDGPLVTAASTLAAPFTFVGDPSCVDNSFGMLNLQNTGVDLAATPFAFSGNGVTYFKDAYTITPGWTRENLKFDDKATARFASVYVKGENGVPAVLALTPDETGYTDRGALYGIWGSPGSRGFDSLCVGNGDNASGVFTVTDCISMFVDYLHLGRVGSGVSGTMAITNSNLDVYYLSSGSETPNDGSNLATTNAVIIGPGATLNVSQPLRQNNDATLKVVFAGGEMRSREGNTYFLSQSGNGHVLVTTEPGCDMVFEVAGTTQYRDIYANGQKVDFDVSGGLVKIGSGILKVAAPIDYAGDTWLNAGVLRISAAGSLPLRPLHAASMTSIALESGGRLAVPSIDGPVRVYSEGSTCGTLAIDSDVDSALPDVSSNVNIEKLGSGTLTADRMTGDKLTVREGRMECLSPQTDIVASRYWRFKVEATRGNANCMQFSEIRLYSLDEEVTQSAQAVTWDTEHTTSIYGGQNHGLPYPATETPEKAWDDDVTTKWLDWRIGTEESEETRDTVWLCFDFGEDKRLITKYEWYTANDESARDPSAWRFQRSDDGETWIDVDVQHDKAVTTDRRVRAYTFDSGIKMLSNDAMFSQMTVDEDAELAVDGFNVSVRNLVNKGTVSFGSESSLTLAADEGEVNGAVFGDFNFAPEVVLGKTGLGASLLVGLDSFGGMLKVDEGTASLCRSMFDPTARFIRFTVKRTHGGNILQMSELSFYDADGKRVNVNMTKADAGTAAVDLAPGSFCKAGNYSTGSGTEDVEKLFDGNTGTKACFNNVTMSDESNESAWRTVVMRLADDAGIVNSYSFTTANDSTPERNPTSWTVEMSVDGVNWVVVDERKFVGAVPTSTYTESEHFVLQPVIDSISELAGDPKSALGAGSSVSVASGARLVLDDGGVTAIRGLTVDMANAGGTIVNFKAAPNGVVDIVNVDGISDLMAADGPLIAFETPAADSAPLASWSVRVNGESTSLHVKQTSAGLELVKFGMIIFVK